MRRDDRSGLLRMMLLVLLAGCGQPTIAFEVRGSGESVAADAGADSGEDCPGQCEPIAPAGWSEHPVLLWMGPPDEAPTECPPRAPSNYYTGFAGLDAPHECDACTCGQPACVLPSGLVASESPLCQGPAFTPFDAPMSWDGACVSPGSLMEEQLRSIIIAPLTVSACIPATVPAPKKDQAARWTIEAYACDGAVTACKDPGKYCVPSAALPPPDFRQCIRYTDIYKEQATCPEAYPDYFRFHDKGFIDNRSCTPCECGAPMDSACSALLSSYQDPACTSLLDAALVTTSGPLCHDIAPGMKLGSMSASLVDDKPGVCAPSGGEPTGEVDLQQLQVFCCQKPDSAQ